ncbi:hypothetical protein PoB_002656400 [Plakobranchus ocellatus]|uniref:Uncharacterized protein n=1 Tax=Plakobranchus ocellatus TaxID=259542 RepID=A0AAV4A1G7_9GAST|nr:hypothetical protein PoB_002656400 [Plakobranchus ocellatus]
MYQKRREVDRMALGSDLAVLGPLVGGIIFYFEPSSGSRAQWRDSDQKPPTQALQVTFTDTIIKPPAIQITPISFVLFLAKAQ